MSSTALPPLPSTRARELEKKAVSLAANINNDDSSDSTRNQSSSLQDDGIKASKADSVKIDKCYGKNGNQLQTSILQNSLQHSMPEERIQQLDTLHKQEQRVFGHHTPLEPNVICDSVHQYIATTSQFLNSFIADANATLEGTNHKLNVLERQMAFLESKLAYIPGLIPGEGEEEEGGDSEEKSDDDDEEGDEEDEEDGNDSS
ncbi:hypothetical protein ACHAXS_005942 [Conticribra weissflogii]